MENTREIGIYIHIPFCKSKCFYCDFTSFSNKDEYIQKYIEVLIKEIKEFDYRNIKEKAIKNHIEINFNKNEKNGNYKVTTIYIGGGTPSFIDSKYIEEILIQLKEKFVLSDNCEITIEVNPGTVNKGKLTHYFNMGINRLSIGLQSCKNKLLDTIGRIHTYQEFLDTYNIAREIGFKNINVDLMLGLPNQNIADLKDSLKKIIKLNPEHISVYSLILEENTKLNELVTNNKIKLPDEELERNMYWYIKNTLELNGYNHYEISNFAKKRFESKHNVNCWNQKEYIGFGLAAHSYLNDIRFSNISNLNEYIENIEHNKIILNIQIEEMQMLDDKKKEYIILGLRKIDGISIKKFKNIFGENPIYIFRNELGKLVNQDLVIIDGDNIKLTNKGLDFANIVWEEFI